MDLPLPECENSGHTCRVSGSLRGSGLLDDGRVRSSAQTQDAITRRYEIDCAPIVREPAFVVGVVYRSHAVRLDVEQG